MKLPFSIFICILAVLLYYKPSIISNIRSIINKSTAPMTATKSSAAATATSNPFAGLPLVPDNDPSLTTPAAMAIPRAIARTVQAASKSEGVGARVRRSIGIPQLRNLAPFLMLDHFTVGAGAGFADHPHRGFETVTYMLSGSTEHEDFSGARGTINTGDLQFMTAGRGVVHAEMPRPGPDGAPPTGLQLWVDLPKALKYCEPRYRDLRAAEIPKDVSADGKSEIKVIAVNQIITYGVMVLGTAQVLFIFNFFFSMFFGKKAEDNPWQAATLEWTVPSPPPHANFGADLPVVINGPHEYGNPAVQGRDYLLQTDPAPGAG